MKTVLLCEDLAFSRATMARTILSIEACSIIEAENGTQAADEIENAPGLDLIIADLLMPRPNGLELLKMVRAGNTAAPRDIPFIVISGAITDEVHDVLAQLDVSRAIAKPVTHAGLADVVAGIGPDGGRSMSWKTTETSSPTRPFMGCQRKARSLRPVDAYLL